MTSLVAPRSLGQAKVLKRAYEGQRLSAGDALSLFNADLHELAAAAQEARFRRVPDKRVTFIVDRNVNYTNVCTAKCSFCAFYRLPSDKEEGYVLPKELIFQKIEETQALGGTGVMLQGGHNPKLKIDYYLDLFSSIKERYDIELHALSPSEIHHIAKVSKMSLRETIRELKTVGLDSIPGGGAEILVERVRQVIAPYKIGPDIWLEVMKTAHEEGLRTTATMVFGGVESLQERIEHLEKLRFLQDQTGGFRAFIPWTLQTNNTEWAGKITEATSLDYLRMLAISRLYLDNFEHVQGSWVTQGMKIGQMSLFFGADDLGSTMIEENVVSSTGIYNTTSLQEMVATVQAAGFQAAQRNSKYQIVTYFS